MDRDKILSAINLTKRLPPSKVHKNAEAISELIPD